MFKWLTYFNAVILSFILSICDATTQDKIDEAMSNSNILVINFLGLFHSCVGNPMPNEQFLTDNIQNFINYPSKTTVGFAPKFTNNRKFFANMLSTAAFKEMLADDEDELRRDLIKKLKYCDEAVMDKDLLKDFYDREVDQSKI